MDTGDLIDRSSSIAERLTTTQAAPPSWLVLATAVAALILVGYGPLWRVTRNVVTIAHEGGHALVALLSGRRLNAITLHSDTSGLTVSSGKPYGFGMILTALAGYPAPPLVGLGFAALLGAGRITLMLWIAIAALALMLVMIRNVYGVISVMTTGALVFAVSWFGSDALQAGFAYLATWLLLLAGSRPVLELQRTRSRMRDGTTDADQLARLTRLPGLLWVAVFLAVALGALVAGAGLLLSATAGICLPIPGGADCPAT
ncbi:M50 family metallopeptidase [Nocardia carnea]|uniref:M50 family metallopeptidase n=1 Tax=Nocardia carnea TaxID=37328 RepID=UPI0024575135|nr:M50 family metallopeptidase [Nocardia carnea]